MVRPEHLRQAGEFSQGKRFCSSMGRGKGPMSRRVPVLGNNQKIILMPAAQDSEEKMQDRIAILGAVNQPGEVLVTLGTRITMLDALGRLAGGLSESADRGSALVLRAGQSPITVNLRALLHAIDQATLEWRHTTSPTPSA